MRRNKKKTEHKISESWLLPYSDLLTLLVALFIVLFAMSEVDVKKYEQLSNFFRSEFSSSSGSGLLEHEAPPEKHDGADEESVEEVIEASKELMELQELQTNVNQYIKESNLSEELGTKLTDEGLLITISNDVSFDSGSAKINQEGRKIAREVSKLIYTNPPHHIVITGHTDNVPIQNSGFGSNWELSVMRAVNFMYLILENEKLDPIHFSAKGYGEFQPIAENTNEANRKKNRRVEVLIMPNQPISTGDKTP